MTTIDSAHALEVAEWNETAPLAARGTLIVVPGRGEHPAVYERFGRRISADAYRVRVVADPTADEDLARTQIADLLADMNLPAPRVLVGSDAGALFAAALVIEETVAVGALILVGLPVAHGDAAASDWAGELDQRTACPTHRARLENDPLLRRGALSDPLPAGWQERVDLSRVTVPVLGIHGGADQISPVAEVARAFATAINAELVTIDGTPHDALNDLTHRTAAARVILFLERLRLDPAAPDLSHVERFAN
jgi:alpha-beta hydrolase superfamily lysophospholipase